MPHPTKNEQTIEALLWWGFLALAFWGIGFWLLPIFWKLEIVIALNMATFCMMGWDKWQAGRRGNRIPEWALYLMALLLGSIGMLVGMQTFRHKTKKTSFQFVIGLIVLVQVIAVALWLFPQLLQIDFNMIGDLADV